MVYKLDLESELLFQNTADCPDTRGFRGIVAREHEIYFHLFRKRIGAVGGLPGQEGVYSVFIGLGDRRPSST